MKIIRFCLPLLLLCSLFTSIRAQTFPRRSPLKSISMGYDAKKHQEWALTKSYKANSHFQNKMELFRRPNDENPEREVISNLLPETNTWQVLAETRYFYSK